MNENDIESAINEIIDLISGHTTVKKLENGLNYGDQDTLMPAT